MSVLERLAEGIASVRGVKLVVVIDAWPVRLDGLGGCGRD